MAQNETWLKHDLLDAVKVQYLDGNLFSMDNAGNLIGVTLTRDGEDYSGGGSVSANVIRSDGGTVAVTGALSGKTATVVLPQAAYAVPGVVSIVVKLTVSGQVTTIAALVANVYRSSTDTAIDPGTIIPSIQTLISQINTAVASIPADYSTLWTKLAPAFSADASYVAGQYVTYNSGLYRFNTTHSGAWSSSDVTAVNLGGEISDLKSALSKESFPFYNPNSNILPACKAIKYAIFYKYPNKTIELYRVVKNSGGAYYIGLADGSGNVYNILNVASSSYTENNIVEFSTNGLEGMLVIDWNSLTNGAYNYQSYDLQFSDLCYYKPVPDYPFENYNSILAADAFIDFSISMGDPSKEVKLERLLKKSGGVYYIQIGIGGISYPLLNIAQASYTEKAYNSFVIDDKTYGYFIIDWDKLTDGAAYNSINKALNVLCKHDLSDKKTQANVEILLPSTISVAVGHEISLTYYNIVKCTNIEEYQVVVSPTNAQIQNLADRLRIVPMETGNETVSIKLYKNDVLIASKSFTLKKIADSAPSIKAIFIGDSMTNAGYYLAELVNMLGSNLTLYGTRTTIVEDADGDSRTVSHEGRPGWSTSTYVGSASSGGVTNPFYNSGFDFSYYMTNNPSYSDVTDVFILLGTNDGAGSTFAANYKTICDSIKAYNSNIRIHCMLPIPPIKSGYAFGVRNYIDYLTYKAYLFNSAKKIVFAYDGESGYFIVPVMANVDCYYDFPQTEVAVNSRNPQLVPVGNDNVHPSKYGYYRFSDVIYSDIVANCGS